MIVLVTLAMLLFADIDCHADVYKYISEDGTVSFTNTPMNTNCNVVVKEKKPVPAAKKEGAVSAKRGTFHDIAEEKALKHNVDPALVKAVIRTESNWNPGAVSRKGALGLMQLMPSTASLMGVGDPFDPEDNIDGGTRYLKYLLEKFNGNLSLALAAYNAGPKRVEKKRMIPSIPETVAYVKKVIAHYTGPQETSYRTISANAKPVDTRIKKIVLQDGTMLFTNSSLQGQGL